jgi:two-component system, sensor histidine kinase and response regulator
VTAALDYAGGDRELLTELLVIFTEESPSQLRALRDAVTRSDPAALGRATHTLRGSLRILGAAPAAALAGRLEELGREGGCVGSPALLATLEAEVERVLRAAAEPLRT